MTRKQRIVVLKLTSPDRRYATAKALAGVNQADLAQAVGISQPLLSQFENGRRVPSAEQQQAIADALDVPADLLFSRLSRRSGAPSHG